MVRNGKRSVKASHVHWITLWDVVEGQIVIDDMVSNVQSLTVADIVGNTYFRWE